MDADAGGVTSMGSGCGGSCIVVDEGSMGIFRDPPL